MERKCECGGKATNFHSKCCNEHFEGVVDENGVLSIVCEKCGKFVANLEQGHIDASKSDKHHRARHKFLHERLDELVADYLKDTDKTLSGTNVIELIEWSYKQTKMVRGGK